MAIDPRKRQKKVERKRAKDKARAVADRRQTRRFIDKALEAIATAPFVHSCYSDTLTEQGIGYVLLGRELSGGRVAYALFLVDRYCLGVKDAMFDIVPRVRYDSAVFGATRSSFELKTLEPACARKLVEGSVEYARNLGLPPHSDYAGAQAIFAGVDAAMCERTFEYGKDGKPLFVAGPNDGAARSAFILRTLQERCGDGGFHFTVPYLPADVSGEVEGTVISQIDAPRLEHS